MNTRGRAIVGARFILVAALALVGAGFTTLPATAVDAAELGAADQNTPLPGAAAWPMPTAHADATDQFVVKLKDKAGIQSVDRQSTFSRLAGKSGVSLQAVRTTANGEDVLQADRRLDSGEAQELAMGLAADPAVEYAEPDTIMRPLASPPNDSYYDVQWGHGTIRALDAWDINQGEGSVVAVVDTGILSHSDLDANILPGYDMISSAAVARDGNGRDPNPVDRGDWSAEGECGADSPAEVSSWHGTHLAGIITAVSGNAKGVAGVAPKAKVLPVRALGVCGGYTSDIVDAIIWAVGGTVSGVPMNPNPARVINLSLGGEAACSLTYQKAIDLARSRGAVVVAAAGNEGVDASAISPANCNGVITVGASVQGDQRAYYSNHGSLVDVYAPGGDVRSLATQGILSTLNTGVSAPAAEAYYLMQGTSMAAPHVAAVAAMMLGAHPSMTPDEVEERIKVTARDMPCYSYCSGGIVDAGAAVLDASLADAPVTPATPTIGSSDMSAGSSLYINMDEWTPKYRVTLDYQWNRNGTPISGATDKWYYLTVDDVGTTTTVTVTGHKTNSPSVAVTSAPTPVIQPANLDTTYPTILGQPYVGNTVTAEPGVWEPAPVDLSYQWYRAESPIPNATASTYKLVSADAGKYLSVTVTGTKPKYKTTARTSPLYTTFAADKVVTPAPVVFNDGPFMAQDSYTVPSTAGVEYLLWGGDSLAPGAHQGFGATKVWAQAKPGYLLLAGSTTEWSTYFSTKGPDFTAPAKSPFKDVQTTQQFYKEMAWLADRKISTGWLEGDKSVTYRPLAPINRDAMAAFLYRMAGSPNFTPPAKSPFKDVLTTQQFYKEMAWLAQTGISSGWTEADGSRTYRPLTPINRDAMAAFLFRLAGSPYDSDIQHPPFSDVRQGQQFYYEMAWMYHKQISKGWLEADGSYSYRALSPINRDAMAAFLYRMP